MLGNKEAREDYDTGSEYAGESCGGSCTSDMFAENVGAQLAKDWQPGSRVSGECSMYCFVMSS